tara:strand:- start:746 stop:1453 length:708 start_codon:yes stop_codon:yes gene_type:complete
MTSHLFEEVIDNKIVEKNKKEPKRKYLGSSVLGDKCSRKIQYMFLGTEPDENKDFDARIYRIFQLGHELENSMAGWIRNAGFDLRTMDGNGEQFGFSIADEKIKGHIDGVICGGPLDVKYPMLWECKSANDKKFRDFKFKGIKANHTYEVQVALYQAYMQLTDNPCLFTVVNKNTSEIFYELVPFNQELAQYASDKGVDILNAVEQNFMLPRIAHSKDMFDCRYCQFTETCWKDG